MDIDLSEVSIDPSWAVKVAPAIALRRLALPLCVVGDELWTAMANPADLPTIAAIEAATGKKVKAVAADAGQLRELLLKIYGDARTSVSVSPQDEPVALVESLLRAATIRRASDIHFDPGREDLRVRMRIDGQLEEFMRIPADLQPAVCSRLKVMAGLDIAEKRAPQDGAFVWRMPGSASKDLFDVRIATLPVRFGERITLRLLESGRDRMTLDRLGMSEADQKTFGKILERPHGLVLMTGPTGSGKTTTLYAAIRALLDSRPLNILTVEDPIEYEIAGVAQAEVDSSDKVNFSKALRSLLRHDPDVVMIGEIRDLESLDTAVKAALTGHLVLSTLHTNDALSAVTRLVDMGLAPHMIGATLRLSAAQRLVRSLCPHCRRPHVISEMEALSAGRRELAGQTAYEACGCVRCAGKGFSGRTGIFELLTPDAEVSSLIASGAKEKEIFAAVRARGFKTIAEDAAEKLLAGITDLGEVIRNVSM